jgi:tRNA pseudouridine38-40 synthase
MRWAAGVQYLGSGYAGWQAQSDGPIAVQSELEAALSSVADHPVATTAAGRTDAGVHAFCQVIHFDSNAARSPYSWLLGSNSRLPEDVSLAWVQPVADDFHARYGALERHYRYVVHNCRARSALLAGRVAWVPRELADPVMHSAVQQLVGEHDFSAFRAAECQAPTAVREVKAAKVWRIDDLVVLDIVANAFLHHMVRNIMGVLLEIGSGERAPQWAAAVLAGRDRRGAGMTAPASGLYFVGPRYAAHWQLPSPARPWFPG